MLRIANLVLSRGTKRLLDGASLAVHYGHKVGVVGANGAGKSSLFAAIRGDLAPDAGSVERPPRWVIAHVAQETPAVATPALEYTQDGDGELRSNRRDEHAPHESNVGARRAQHGAHSPRSLVQSG